VVLAPQRSSNKLRLHFVTEDDPLYVVSFFEVFFAEYPREEFDVVGMTIDRAFREPRRAIVRRMLRFYGPRDFARLLLRFAGARIRRRSIAAVAQREEVPLLATNSVNDPDYIRRLREISPDIIISVAAPEIFRDEIITVPRLGCVNIHSGRLPTYRGMMPTFWQMRAGEPHATVTVHELVRTLDAGDVLGTLEYPVLESDSLDRVMIGTKREGARLMIDVLRQIRAGQVRPKPLDMADASYFSFPSREDVEEFRRRGHRLL
jgi:methionyl-tRNA formyltransferase